MEAFHVLVESALRFDRHWSADGTVKRSLGRLGCVCAYLARLFRRSGVGPVEGEVIEAPTARSGLARLVVDDPLVLQPLERRLERLAVHLQHVLEEGLPEA